MIVRGRDFTDIYDLVGVRVLVDSVRDCYAVLGALHARWNPVPGRFKDYIAMPKFNMYQSLHTTVIGPEGKPVEIQIRTHAMHRRAEYGVAAHWKYKDDPNAVVDRTAATSPNDMNWLRQLLDWQRETSDPGEFLDSLRFEINAQEVYVFTPKGDVVPLPAGSTPVDFAYAVHTEVGHRCIGARVNGRLVPLESTLDNGDVVEIFTSKADGAGPEPGLADVRQEPAGAQQDPAVVLQGAPRGGDRAGQGRDRQGDAQAGPADPAAACRTSRSSRWRREMRYPDVSGLYAAVGEGHVSAASVVQRLVADARRRGGRGGGPRRGAPAPTAGAGGHGPVTPASSSRAWTPTSGSSWPSAARRCRATRSSASSPGAAASPCTATTAATSPACRSQPERIIEVEWAPTAASVFLVQIQVEALDRARLLSDITRVLSDDAREHPGRDGLDDPGPGRDLAVHLRDGRDRSPGPRDQRRPQDRGRLRRLPRHRQPPRLSPSRRERIQPPKSASALRACSSHSSRACSACSASRTARSPPPARAESSSPAQPGDRRLQLVHGVLRAGPRLRVAARPPLLLGVPDRLLDGPQPALDPAEVGARHLAGGLPAVLDVAQRRPGRLRVAHRQQGLGLDEQLLLDLEVLAELGLDLVVRRRPGREERVLRGAEPRPQRVVLLARRPPGRLPLLHEVAEGRGRRRPVGRRRRAPRHGR